MSMKLQQNFRAVGIQVAKWCGCCLNCYLSIDRRYGVTTWINTVDTMVPHCQFMQFFTYRQLISLAMAVSAVVACKFDFIIEPHPKASAMRTVIKPTIPYRLSMFNYDITLQPIDVITINYSYFLFLFIHRNSLHWNGIGFCYARCEHYSFECANFSV